MVFSILTEFVENESVNKQDCKLNPAKRLMKKLKYKFRKLNICILGNSLYSCESMYELFDEYKWKFIFGFKDGRAKTLWEEIQTIKKIQSGESNTDFTYINEVSYQRRLINAIDFNDTSNNISKNFVFVTNIKLTPKMFYKFYVLGKIDGKSRMKDLIIKRLSEMI